MTGVWVIPIEAELANLKPKLTVYILYIIFSLPLSASWWKFFFRQCQQDKSIDTCEYREVEMAEKYLWEEGTWYIIVLTGSTHMSVLCKLLPAATEFWQLHLKKLLPDN